MSVNGIEIKVGQKWRTRGGGTAVIAHAGETVEGMKEEFKVADTEGHVYTCTGRYALGVRSHKHDLVELIEDAPVPTPHVDEVPLPVVEPIIGNAKAYLPTEAPKAPKAPKAPDLLEAAAGHMLDRAASYDKPEGERSMAQTVAIFNLHHGAALTEAQGWHFMQILKDVRLFTNVAQPHRDSCEDGIAYAALKAEALLNGGAQ